MFVFRRAYPLGTPHESRVSITTATRWIAELIVQTLITTHTPPTQKWGMNDKKRSLSEVEFSQKMHADFDCIY